MLTGSIAWLYVLCLRYVCLVQFWTVVLFVSVHFRNPWLVFAATVAVVGFVCLWCVCLPVKPHFSPLEHLFALQ